MLMTSVHPCATITLQKKFPCVFLEGSQMSPLFAFAITAATRTLITPQSSTVGVGSVTSWRRECCEQARKRGVVF